MIDFFHIINSVFTSKTYIIYKEGISKAWLVDMGDIEPVMAFLNEKHLDVAGVLSLMGISTTYMDCIL